jgi:glycyl-tRNA synthetase beta chain
MVGEFPELQGIMGRYYATAQGESAEIADAIRDHYKPLGAGDDNITESLPQTDLAAAIAVADKMDSIISLFAVGEKPTGSKDPLALRRAALGILRIMRKRNWQIDLASLISNQSIKVEVITFFKDRLHNLLRDDGIRYDVIEAIIHSTSDFRPVPITKLACDLHNWALTEDGKKAIAAIKRAMKLLTAEEKIAKITFDAGYSDTLTLPVEKALIATLKELDSRLRGNDKKPETLEVLTAPIDLFFDREKGVQVTEVGFREARLSLLAAVRDAANTIADFSKIEG